MIVRIVVTKLLVFFALITTRLCINRLVVQILAFVCKNVLFQTTDDNVVEYNQDTIEEFIVSYYKGRRRGRFQIWSYFRDMVRVPASIVPSLFIIIGIVVPIAVLALVYIAPFPVTAIAGIIFLFSLIRLNNRRVFEGKKKKFYFTFYIYLYYIISNVHVY